MKISTLLRILSCAFVATALSLNAFAQTQVGVIKAARVQGEVLKLGADGASSSAIKDGDLLTEKDVITTGKSSSVVLVFSNASTVRLGPETRLAIEVFKTDPLADPLSDLATRTEEPNVSKTELNLSYGEMVGDVKKLNTSSTYSIKTPVGAAGIRGTIYRIVFKPSSDGKAFFQIQTAEGKVLMEGVANVSNVLVEDGKEVVVEIDTEKAGPPSVQNKDISDADKAAIATVAAEIVETLKTTVIDNTPPPPPSEPQPEEKKEETPPPPPVQDTPDLTPGSGKA